MLAVLRALHVADERHSLGEVNGEVMLLSVSVFQVCQRCATQFTAIDMCAARQIYVVRPKCSFMSRVLLTVSCTAIVDTMAVLHGLADQYSIPGGDTFLRSSQTSSSKDVPVSIFTTLQPEQ